MKHADLMPKDMAMPDAFSYQAGQDAATDLLKFIGKDGTLLTWESAALGFLGCYLTTVAATLGNSAAEGSQARIIKSLERPMLIQKISTKLKGLPMTSNHTSLSAEQVAEAHAWALKVSKASGSQYTPSSRNSGCVHLVPPRYTKQEPVAWKYRQKGMTLWNYAGDRLGQDYDAAYEYVPLYLRPAPAAVPEWRPIETAPKTGEPILASDSNGGIYITAWEPDVYTWQGGSGGPSGWFSGRSLNPWRDHPVLDTPTHWMPLPASPENGGK